MASLSQLGYELVEQVYHHSFLITTASGLSYMAGKWISLLNLDPWKAAQFTGIATTASIVVMAFTQHVNEQASGPSLSETGSTLRICSSCTVVLLTGYGLYAYASPEKTLKSFMKVSLIALVNFVGLYFLLSLCCSRNSSPSERSSSSPYSHDSVSTRSTYPPSQRPFYNSRPTNTTHDDADDN